MTTGATTRAVSLCFIFGGLVIGLRVSFVRFGAASLSATRNTVPAAIHSGKRQQKQASPLDTNEVEHARTGLRGNARMRGDFLVLSAVHEFVRQLGSTNELYNLSTDHSVSSCGMRRDEQHEKQGVKF